MITNSAFSRPRRSVTVLNHQSFFFARGQEERFILLLLQRTDRTRKSVSLDLVERSDVDRLNEIFECTDLLF